MRRALAVLVVLFAAACFKFPPVPVPSPSPSPSASPTPAPTPEPPTCNCAYPDPCPPGQHRPIQPGPPPCYCNIYGACEAPPPEPPPDDGSYPDHCPKMACWKPQQTLFGPDDLKVGNKITIDSTEFFDVCLPRGRCEVDGVNVVCGGRPCEDPRGVRWYQSAGPKIQGAACPDRKGNPKPCTWQVQANESGNGDPDTGYQLQVQLPARGTYTICVAPLPDLRDHLGQPVEAMPDAGRCTTFTVS